MADPVYQKVKKDSTPATERKVLQLIRELEKKDFIPRNLAGRLKPSACKPPKLYGLPKKHRNDVPFRPTVPCIDSLDILPGQVCEHNDLPTGCRNIILH